MKPLDPLAIPAQGVQLIEASAGTGKTYTITNLYLRLLLTRGLEVPELLVVTYTRAATAELRERIRHRLRQAQAFLAGDRGDADPTLRELLTELEDRGMAALAQRRLEHAIHSFDQAAIWTIHGFCQRVLGELAFETGFPFQVSFVEHVDPLLDEIANDFFVENLRDSTETFTEWMLARRETRPASLSTLVRLVTDAEQLRVLPNTAEGLAVSPPARAARESLADALQAFEGNAEEISQLLLTDAALDRRVYRRDWVKGWLAEIATAQAEGAGPLDPRAKRLLGLSNEKLQRRAKGPAPRHAFFDLCGRFAAARAELDVALDDRLLQLKLDLCAFARGEGRRRKQAQAVMSFADLLSEVDRALAGPAGPSLVASLKHRFKAALIDEFQDTDPIQYRVFRSLFGEQERGLFLIGDPKQAIYSFRGADIFAYIRAARDAASSAHTLAVNYRSDPGLLAAVGAIFGRTPAPFLLEEIDFTPVAPRPGADNALEDPTGAAMDVLFVDRSAAGVAAGKRIAKGPGTRLVIDGIVAEVTRLLNGSVKLHGRPVAPGDIAILCRTNAQARDLQTKLSEQAVPTVLMGDDSVLESDDAFELDVFLGAVLEPSRPTLLRAALATSVGDMAAHEIVALGADEARWDDWVERLQRWGATWRERGFYQAFRQILGEHQVAQRLLVRADGERRLTNLLHLGELLQVAAREQHLGPLSLHQWLRRMRTDVAARREVASESAQVRLESDARRVQLQTIHRSKGLEYPIVLLPFLWGGRFRSTGEAQWARYHDPALDGCETLDVGSAELPAHRDLASWEASAEALRLAYVAMTRAKHKCSIVWGGFATSETSPLAHLLHAPGTPAHVQQLDDEAMRSDLESLAAESGGNLRVRPLPSLSREPSWPSVATGPVAVLAPPSAPRAVDTTFRTSSFSALVRRGPQTEGVFLDGIDRDQHTGVAGSPAVADPLGPRVRLADFPAGAGPGQLIHDVLELVVGQDPGLLSEEVPRALRRYQFPPELAAPLQLALGEMLQTPFGRGELDFSLAGLAAANLLSEMEFVVPVSRQGERRITGRDLASTMARYGGVAVRDYAPALGKLGFAPLAGYLRGFIDLLFLHGNRWYVVDYKSNYLGATAADYATPRLHAAMAEHHYYLQYHLYVVALHRHLTLRQPDYDYDRDFGGVLYLFVRGMAPNHPAGNGVYFERPSGALVRALDTQLQGGRR